MSSPTPRVRLSYPIDEGLAWLGIGHQRGYDLINAGLLETFKIGRRRMVTHAALEDCLKRLQSNARPEAKKRAAA